MLIVPSLRDSLPATELHAFAHNARRRASSALVAGALDRTSCLTPSPIQLSCSRTLPLWHKFPPRSALRGCSTGARNWNLLHGQFVLLDPPEVAIGHNPCRTTTRYPGLSLQLVSVVVQHQLRLVPTLVFDLHRIFSHRTDAIGNQATTMSKLDIADVCCSSRQRTCCAPSCSILWSVPVHTLLGHGRLNPSPRSPGAPTLGSA